MKDMMPYLEIYGNYVFFEPKPNEKADDSSLEGCLRHAAKLEQMIDKNNLYECEKCTEEKFGKSKIAFIVYLHYVLLYRIKKKAPYLGFKTILTDWAS